MILRRTTGLTICWLLLQLNITSVVSACEHREQSPAPALQGVAVPTTTETAHHEHESRDERVPCEIPSPGDCCLAVASCSITFATGSSSSTSGPGVLRVVIEPPADRAPTYLIRPPEPPPPKA